MILKDKKLHCGGQPRQNSLRKFSNENKEWACKNFLTIAPALPLISEKKNEAPKTTHKSINIISAPKRLNRSESVTLDMAPLDIIYLETTGDGKIQATRSQKDKEKNPDRICLDRRGLTHLPYFVNEKNIRLLSLQHNLINRIDSFSNVGINKLVFLDLYNNQIEKINGLESLENLRVLLVGKNKLKKTESIKSLTKLEVLDLHGNQINKITSLNTLCELKVLNLAGNKIRAIEENDLEGLLSLQELNLKKNRLRKIIDLSGPLQLEKLFLSNNEILSIDDLISICKAVSLKEITIDNNPVIVHNECVHLLVSCLPNLQILSHMQVTEQLKKNAMLWRKNRDNLLKAIAIEVKGKIEGEGNSVDAICSAKANWEMLRRQSNSPSLNDLRILEDQEYNFDRNVQSDSVLSVASTITLSSRESLSTLKTTNNRKTYASKKSLSEDTAEVLESMEYFKLPPILACLANNNMNNLITKSPKGQINPTNEIFTSETSEGTGDQVIDDSEEEDTNKVEEVENNTVARSKSANQPRKNGSKRERCFTAKSKPKYQSPAPGKIREQGGDYLIEICGRCLNIYGQGALRLVDRPWNPVKAGDVTTVKFNYVSFGGICNILAKLKHRFPNVENFIFKETNITCLGQLNALADVQGISSLYIEEEGNPIFDKNWRNYAIYRLAHWGLKTVNGNEVTEEDLKRVTQEFQSLSDLVLWSLPDSLLQPLLNRLRIENNRSNFQQTAKQWLFNTDPALRSVICKEALQWRKGTQDDLFWRLKGKNYLSNIIDSTCSAVEKLEMFEIRWPSILNQLIKDTLVDYSQMNSYMKKCLQQFQ